MRLVRALMVMGLCVGGCNADYVHFIGPGSVNLSATMWTPGFNFTMDEGSQVIIRRGGFADTAGMPLGFVEIMSREDSLTGGVPPVLPQPDSE